MGAWDGAGRLCKLWGCMRIGPHRSAADVWMLFSYRLSCSGIVTAFVAVFSYSRYCSLPAVYEFACKNTHKFLKIKIKSHISACGGRNMAFEIRVVCAGGCVAGVATERLRCHMWLLCRSQSGFVSFCVSCGFFAPKRAVYMRSVAPR